MSGADVVGGAGQPCDFRIAERRRDRSAGAAAFREGDCCLLVRCAGSRSRHRLDRGRDQRGNGRAPLRRGGGKCHAPPGRAGSGSSCADRARPSRCRMRCDPCDGGVGALRDPAERGAAHTDCRRRRRPRRAPHQGQGDVDRARLRCCAARVRAGRRLRQGATPVRAADRQVPGDPAQAGKLPDRARRRQADPRSHRQIA